MWTVIFSSSDREKIDAVLKILEQRNIMSRQKAHGQEPGALIEVMVPQTELETAQDIIFDSEIL